MGALSQALFAPRGVALDEARAMIAELPELKLIQGFRGLPKGDAEALARALRALSLLATLKGRPVREAAINPLFIRAAGQGVVAVDGLLGQG